MKITTVNYTIRSTKYQVQIVRISNVLFYRARDIGNLLNIKKIRNSIRNYNSKHKFIINTKTNGGQQNMIFISENGVKKLIANSRSIYAYDVAQLFKFNIIDIYTGNIESNTLIQIITVFKHEKYIHQYVHKNYKIDLYFPDYRLAIECDEEHHKNQKMYDLKRQQSIEDDLQCFFIRYSPNDITFNILNVIHNIYEYIRNYNNFIK